MEIEIQLPLTESTLFISLSLAPGPRHGYAIPKDVQPAKVPIDPALAIYARFGVLGK
jgi:hypothetical protein